MPERGKIAEEADMAKLCAERRTEREYDDRIKTRKRLSRSSRNLPFVPPPPSTLLTAATPTSLALSRAVSLFRKDNQSSLIETMSPGLCTSVLLDVALGRLSLTICGVKINLWLQIECEWRALRTASCPLLSLEPLLCLWTWQGIAPNVATGLHRSSSFGKLTTVWHGVASRRRFRVDGRLWWRTDVRGPTAGARRLAVGAGLTTSVLSSSSSTRRCFTDMSHFVDERACRKRLRGRGGR
ncbi:hypothetical protein MRB53_036983 [Persea americana]|nr:hypothetical protein MRB53_036983 [Persea americana]